MKKITNSPFAAALVFTAVLLLAVILLASCTKVETTDSSGEPSPLLTEILNHLSSALAYYDDITEQYKTALDDVNLFLAADDIETEQVIMTIENTIKKLDETTLPVNSLKSKQEQFRNEKLSYPDFESLYTLLPITNESYKNSLNLFHWYLTKYTLDDRDEMLATNTEIYLTILENEIRLQYIALNLFLVDIDEDIASQFRTAEIEKLPSYKREALAYLILP